MNNDAPQHLIGFVEAILTGAREVKPGDIHVLCGALLGLLAAQPDTPRRTTFGAIKPPPWAANPEGQIERIADYLNATDAVDPDEPDKPVADVAIGLLKTFGEMMPKMHARAHDAEIRVEDLEAFVLAIRDDHVEFDQIAEANRLMPESGADPAEPAS